MVYHTVYFSLISSKVSAAGRITVNTIIIIFVHFIVLYVLSLVSDVNMMRPFCIYFIRHENNIYQCTMLIILLWYQSSTDYFKYRRNEILYTILSQTFKIENARSKVYRTCPEFIFIGTKMMNVINNYKTT